MVFGDEGGLHIVGENSNELLAIVAADVEPMIDRDSVSYYKSPEHEPRPEHEAYRKWLADNVGIKPATRPDAVVKKAQKRYGAVVPCGMPRLGRHEGGLWSITI